MEIAGEKVAFIIGRLCGLLLYFFDKRHRTVASQNILDAKVAHTFKEADQLVKKVYEHMGYTIAEIVVSFRRIYQGRLLKYVKFEGLDYLKEALSKDHGAILVVAHLGNWELAGVALSHLGFPLNSVARPLDNLFLEGYLQRFRSLTGQKIIIKYNAFQDMVDILKKNELLAIVADQDARDDGVFVDFFGILASTIKSPAILSLRYNAPIITTETYHDKERLIVNFNKPIYSNEFKNEKNRVRGLTSIYTSKIEDFVRRHPEQWFWLHRRWKTRPRSKESLLLAP
jgi:KDO2-lipid IV(A) lauroyltransferase